MYQKILEHIEIIRERRKALKSLRVQRYQTAEISDQLKQDLNLETVVIEAINSDQHSVKPVERTALLDRLKSTFIQRRIRRRRA